MGQMQMQLPCAHSLCFIVGWSRRPTNVARHYDMVGWSSRPTNLARQGQTSSMCASAWRLPITSCRRRLSLARSQASNVGSISTSTQACTSHRLVWWWSVGGAFGVACLAFVLLVRLGCWFVFVVCLWFFAVAGVPCVGGAASRFSFALA